MLDTVIEYFLGAPPDLLLYPELEVQSNLYYMGSLILKILFFVMLLEVFRMIRKFI